MTIFDMLDELINSDGSDIHIIPDSPPLLRVYGKLVPVKGSKALSEAEAKALIFPLLTQEQKDYVSVNKEMDFGYQFEDKGRFRANIYTTRGRLAIAMRLIPTKIKTIEELGLPPVLHDFIKFPQGLVLLTGPTGEGKSTTLAALIDEINRHKSVHIVTIEDPIEFSFQPIKSVVSQREIIQDTHGWDIALRSVLREDPDVVMIGEMRDYETIAAALTIAETGHLVLATLHTGSAAETIDRIIDVFPSNQQQQVRQQLAATVRVVASQRLLPSTDGKRVAALEIMFSTASIRNLIREQKLHQIDSVIQTSAAEGMILFEKYLAMLVQQGRVTAETAKDAAFRPEEMARLLGAPS